MTLIEDFDSIDDNRWETKSCGNVNNSSISITANKLKVLFSATKLGSNTGNLSKILKNKTLIIPSEIEFTLEVNSTANPGFNEYSAILVISDTANGSLTPYNNPVEPCTDLQSNALFFSFNLSWAAASNNFKVTKVISSVYTNLYTNLNNYDISTISTWKIILSNQNTIKIYLNESLIYSSTTFNLPFTKAYISFGMWSSSELLDYVLCDYIYITTPTATVLGNAFSFVQRGISSASGTPLGKTKRKTIY